MKLILQQEGDWVRLVGPAHKQFIEFLKYSIRPPSLRKYDPSTQTWLVYWTQLQAVAGAARRFYSIVDWSTLPDAWQMCLVGGQAPAVAPPIKEINNPYAILFVTEDAPMEIIRAAYRVLAALHHPDIGGITDKMAELNAAYDQICLNREQDPKNLSNKA